MIGERYARDHGPTHGRPAVAARRTDRAGHPSAGAGHIGAELVRSITVGTVAGAAALAHLTLPHLYAVAAVIGAATQFGGPARMLMIRAVVPTPQLTAAPTQDEGRPAA